MLWNHRENARFLTNEGWNKYVRMSHGIFSRQGGKSVSPYDSLNVSPFQGDLLENVSENHHAIQKALGIESLVFLEQVHGGDIVILDQPLEPSVQLLGKGDDLITQQKGVGLMICHADCQAALFYEPFEDVIAAVHCGWRGLVENIYDKTINLLEAKFYIKREHLLVSISPSLGPCHSEFKNYQEEFPKSFQDFMVRPNYFDLWAIAKEQLKQAGMQEKNISIASLCTVENESDFFSYRRNKKSGRNGSVIALVS